MSRKGGRRPLSLEERVNIAEGEDELSDSDDGLDMIKKRAGQTDETSFAEYINSINSITSNANSMDIVDISSDSPNDGDSKKRKRPTLGTGKAERVDFDSDEDPEAAYISFKKRKSEKRKKTLAETKELKARAKKGSLVGMKRKPANPLNEGRRRKDKDWLESDDENDLMETTLPEYLQRRRSSWFERKEKLGDAGLLLPPSYDEVDFSGDERMETLKERPVFKNGVPQRKYADIDLPYSAGIIPAPIAQWLREYQIEGTAWLHERFVHQKGGILGDDMGLGKTIQVIAFLTAAFGKTGDERDSKRMRKMRRSGEDEWYPRVLIICPGGLKANWQNELQTWGWWHVYEYHGSATAKQEALAAAQTGRLEIMITTYTTYRLNKSAINGIRWDCVVADECHTIKERKADITEAMNEVNALCRIGLTGTAIQNKYEELWTLLNWTNPGCLGPLSRWRLLICVPLKLGQSHDATYEKLSKARRTASALVKNLLPQFFLRRMKSLIADQLPKKSDQVVFCPMTETQIEAYNNFCDSEMVRAIFHAAEPCQCGLKLRQGWCCYAEIDGKPWQHFVFPCMMTLQKLANHLALLLPTGGTDREKHEKEMEILETALPNTWEELYRQRDNILNFANSDFCGKWKVLRKLLKFWHQNGDKVLVFSYSVRLLRMLHLLFGATTSYTVSYLDGSMPYDDRQRVVDEYNSNPKQFVFLISTKAGGVGLNITSANKVVVVDPNWNPAYDLQAQDRAYRLGQTRDVEVFRLISVGTVEEIVYARQIYKQQQANIGYNAAEERRYFKGVQDEKDLKGEIFGLKNLFAPVSENVKLRDIVNRTNVAETRAGVEIAGLHLEPDSKDGHEDGEENGDTLLSDKREYAAMSDLANSIIDAPSARRAKAAENAKKEDAVQAILASAGVQYTHENAQVVGTSKIETKISRRAQKAGSMLELEQEFVFQGSQEAGKGPMNGDLDEETDDDGEGRVRYRYRPPEDVRRRQFCTMARGFGYEDVTEFALVVEGWTQEQRRDCLEKFYQERRAVVAGLKG